MDYINLITKKICTHRQVTIETGASIPVGQNYGDWRPILKREPPQPVVGKSVIATDPVEIDGQWFYGWGLRDTSIEEFRLSIEQLTDRNNAAYESAIAALTADYPPSEIATWERQRAEALAWAADSSAPTPWIDIAAAARGIERTLFLGRTHAKAEAFAQASAYLTGLRQRYDDAIRAATTPEQLQAIVIDYALPVSA